ncbi:MAG: hypothetical protein IKI47_02580, partial [Prevotella sp.]|nr:hypothetical protein [Prevotella sp.]
KKTPFRQGQSPPEISSSYYFSCLCKTRQRTKMPAPHTTGNKPEKGRKRVQRYNYSNERQNFSGIFFIKN